MSGKSIDSMSLTECVAELNSGKFIAGSTKRKLNERIEFLQKISYENSNRFNVLNPINIETKKISDTTEDYPILKSSSDSNLSTSTDSNSNLKRSASIDYSKLISKSSEIKKFPSMISNNKIHVDYSHFMNIYNEAAIHRIRMHYITLNRKLSIISLLTHSKNKFTDFIINKYNVKELLFEEKKMYTSLLIIMSLNRLLNNFKSGYVVVLNRKIRDIESYVNSYYDSVGENYYNVYLDRYNLAVSGIIYNMNKIVEELIFCTETEQFVNRINSCIIEIEKVIETVISENDPFIECEYYVSICDSVEQPIKITGISGGYYVNTDSSIDTTVELVNIPEKEVDLWDIYQIEYLLNYQETVNRKHILTIYNCDKNMPAKLHFNISNRLELSDMTYILVVDNLPSGSKYLTSIYKNLPQIPLDSINIIQPIINKFAVWIDKNTHAIDLDAENYFSDDDNYTDIDNEYFDTNRNLINKLFEVMLEADLTGELIDPASVGSFRKLAYETTPCVN